MFHTFRHGHEKKADLLSVAAWLAFDVFETLRSFLETKSSNQ